MLTYICRNGLLDKSIFHSGYWHRPSTCWIVSPNTKLLRVFYKSRLGGPGGVREINAISTIKGDLKNFLHALVRMSTCLPACVSTLSVIVIPFDSMCKTVTYEVIRKGSVLSMSKSDIRLTRAPDFKLTLADKTVQTCQWLYGRCQDLARVLISTLGKMDSPSHKGWFFKRRAHIQKMCSSPRKACDTRLYETPKPTYVCSISSHVDHTASISGV